MKLARLGAPGREHLAILDADGLYRDLSAYFPDLNRSGFAGGSNS